MDTPITTYSYNLPTGVLVALILFGVALWLVLVIAYINIIRRAGYSPWWILIMLVPVANVVMLLVFAFKEWPIQQELRELRGWANQIQRSTQPPYDQQPFGQPFNHRPNDQGRLFGQRENPSGPSQGQGS